YRAIRMDPHTEITPVVAIPAKPLSTAAARTLLPATVPYTEAVANAARAALLAPAMTRDPNLLFAATYDWLHQQYLQSAMPATVPYTEAVANASLASLLAPAMTRDPKLLSAATEDWLHQQYRQPSMPETLAHITALRAQGHAAVVSGAGPTLCVFAADSDETN